MYCKDLQHLFHFDEESIKKHQVDLLRPKIISNLFESRGY